MYCIREPPANAGNADANAPTLTEILSGLAKEIVASEVGAVFADIGRSWGTMGLTIFTALVLSIGYMWLLSVAARALALFCLAVSILSFFGFGIALIVVGA